MTDSAQDAVATILDEQNADLQLLDYIDGVETPIELQDSGLEVIRVQRDLDGNVVVASSVKLPNLRFRLGDLLLETTSSGMTAAGTLDKPWVLALTAIRFLRTVRKLATLDIRQEDAEMLIAIFRLAQEDGLVRVDDLPSVLSDNWDEARIAGSLERLDLLACIELGMEGIVLNETIIVQQRD